ILAGETVIYKNDLNLVPLRRFTSKEIDLFFVMCNKLKEQNTRKLQIDFKELKHLSNYYHRSLDRFTQDLEQVYDKMLMLTYSQRSGKNFEKFVLFTSYKVNVDEQFLEIAINPDLKHILNSITGDFTKFELEELSKLKSSYAKNMFRLLKQYKHTGFLKLDINDFRERLDIPESYKMNDINKRVLKPIVKELNNLFNNLSINKIQEKSRRKIEWLEFQFDTENRITTKQLRSKADKPSTKRKTTESREMTPEWLLEDKAKDDKRDKTKKSSDEDIKTFILKQPEDKKQKLMKEYDYLFKD